MDVDEKDVKIKTIDEGMDDVKTASGNVMHKNEFPINSSFSQLIGDGKMVVGEDRSPDKDDDELMLVDEAMNSYFMNDTDSGVVCQRDEPTSSNNRREFFGPLFSRNKSSSKYSEQKLMCLKLFNNWSDDEQVNFIENILDCMYHSQHSRVNSYLKPKLQRDFIGILPKLGLSHIAEAILSKLDHKDLVACEMVSKSWNAVVSDCMLWQKLIKHNVNTKRIWKGLGERRGWISHIDRRTSEMQNDYFRNLYPDILKDIKRVETNWRLGRHTLHRIHCRSENSKGVYCLQYDENKVVSGLRDNTIKIWNKQTLALEKTLTGHTGSVLCLQYDDKIIISGSSDSTVRVWDADTGESVNTLIHHCEAVLHLRFGHGLMVTCSKDRSIAVWDMISAREINLRRNLSGHRAAVNVVDFDQKYIVSASGDRTIKVWDTQTCEFVRNLSGHRRGIACLQYLDPHVVSGSSDFTIRIWDVEHGVCLRVLEGHEELVRCIRFDQNRIVSGAYDGKIKVWDFKAAMESRTPPSAPCVQTLDEHTGRVFRLQFDEFQIVSSSHDDTILIWDFFNVSPEGVLQNRVNDDFIADAADVVENMEAEVEAGDDDNAVEEPAEAV